MDDWHYVTATEFKINGGVGLLFHYRGSLYAALKAVYPEYPWEDKKFQQLPRKYWHDVQNRKNFLDLIAKEYGIF
jgi:hypothetical protein